MTKIDVIIRRQKNAYKLQSHVCVVTSFWFANNRVPDWRLKSHTKTVLGYISEVSTFITINDMHKRNNGIIIASTSLIFSFQYPIDTFVIYSMINQINNPELSNEVFQYTLKIKKWKYFFFNFIFILIKRWVCSRNQKNAEWKNDFMNRRALVN